MGTMYIRLQAYVYIYQCIYIYTRSPSLDTLCPIRLSLKPCWLLPPRGFLHFHFFKFFKNQKFKSFRISVPQKKHVAKLTVISLAQKKRSPFFNWRIGESVLGQAAVLSPISRSSPRTLPIASQQIGPFTAPGSRRSLSSSRLGESAKLEREGTLANHDFI